MRSTNIRILHISLAIVVGLLILMTFLVLSVPESRADHSIYTPDRNHVVTLTDAKSWTGHFQVQATSKDLIAGYFSRSIFDKILSEGNCTGIRIYNARHNNGDPVFVLVGVDRNGKDVIAGAIGEGGLPCPPQCGDGSPLMSVPSDQLASAR